MHILNTLTRSSFKNSLISDWDSLEVVRELPSCQSRFEENGYKGKPILRALTTGSSGLLPASICCNKFLPPRPGKLSDGLGSYTQVKPVVETLEGTVLLWEWVEEGLGPSCHHSYPEEPGLE